MSTPARVIAAFATLCLISYGVGLYMGRSFSPDWDDRATVQLFASKQVILEKSKDGQDVLSFQCGPQRFEYDVLEDAVDVVGESFQSAKAEAKLRGVDPAAIPALAVFLGAKPIKTLPEMLEYLGASKDKWTMAAATVGAAFGLWYGVRHGYEAEPDCTNSTTVTTLKDLSLWRVLAELPKFKNAMR